MTVKNNQEAWEEVNKLFPYDYEKMKRLQKRLVNCNVCFKI